MLCVSVLALTFSAAIARDPGGHDGGQGVASALLQDPVTGNLLTVLTTDTTIRHNSDGTWAAHATSVAHIELLVAGGTALTGTGRVVINGEFEPDSETAPLAGGHWNLEQLNIT